VTDLVLRMFSLTEAAPSGKNEFDPIDDFT